MTTLTPTMPASGSVQPHGSSGPYWIEVTFEDGWEKHTRTDDRNWALGMASWLKAKAYKDARVKDSSGNIVEPKTEVNTGSDHPKS